MSLESLVVKSPSVLQNLLPPIEGHYGFDHHRVTCMMDPARWLTYQNTMSCFGYSRSQLWLFPYPTGESWSLLICKHTNIPFWRLKDSPVRQAVPTGNLTRQPGAVVSVPGSLGHVADLGPCAPGGNSETWGWPLQQPMDQPIWTMFLWINCWDFHLL